MKIKFLGLVLAGMMMTGGAAQAAPVLDVVTSNGTATTIGGASDAFFDLGLSTGLGAGSAITVFNGSTASPFGLSLSETGNLTFEYLGSDAGYTNSFSTPAGSFSSDGSNSIGDMFSANNVGAGLLDFVMQSDDGVNPISSAFNNGPIGTNMAYAVAVLSETSVILLLDDGGLGTDFDDLAIKVSVSEVPLPAAAWLLISAILGLVSFSRIRRNGTPAA
jgi:hypothetical protein